MIVRDLLAFLCGFAISIPVLSLEFQRGRRAGRCERWREIDDALSHRGLSLSHLLRGRR